MPTPDDPNPVPILPPPGTDPTPQQAALIAKGILLQVLEIDFAAGDLPAFEMALEKLERATAMLEIGRTDLDNQRFRGVMTELEASLAHAQFIPTAMDLFKGPALSGRA